MAVSYICDNQEAFEKCRFASKVYEACKDGCFKTCVLCMMRLIAEYKTS